MTRLVALHDHLAFALHRQSDWLLPTVARLIFAAVLAGYFWSSGLTKLDGPFTPTLGGYAQIFPKVFEAVGYDASRMGFWPRLVVVAGAWAELALPLLLILGLLTRLAALGMAGFVVVQSLTDIYGHEAGAGTWFDRASDALILDQRSLWMLLFLVLILKGGGPLAVDRALRAVFPRLAT